MAFGQKEYKEIEVDSGSEQHEIETLKKSIHRQIISMAICFIVAIFATVAFITKAWFAKNEQVSSNGASIAAHSATASIYIRKPDGKMDYLAKISDDAVNVPLFPSSTKDLENWWYASEFSYKDKNGNPIPEAIRYEKISIKENVDIPYTYYNEYEQKDLTAYFKTDVKLYTTADTSMEVYLAPENPIMVAYKIDTDDMETNVSKTDTANKERRLLKALRVGLLVGDGDEKKTLIYAPYAENTKGNDSSTIETQKFYSITGVESVEQNSDVITETDWENNAYIAGEGIDDNTYIAGKTPLGTADDKNGLNVSVFVWLEGTDGEARVGVSDGDTQKINVDIAFVGVAEEESDSDNLR